MGKAGVSLRDGDQGPRFLGMAWIGLGVKGTNDLDLVMVVQIYMVLKKIK